MAFDIKTGCNITPEEMIEFYTYKYGNEKDAVRQFCKKFNLFYYEWLYEHCVERKPEHLSAIRYYLRNLNLMQFKGKTYQDTLIQEQS
jgi:hypothetical protein